MIIKIVKLLKDLDVNGKRVFLRADLDVPLEEGDVEAATRLTNIKPTVDWLVEHGASQIIIAGHIDRPTGPDPEKSTKKLLESLEKILGRKIEFVENFSGPVNTFPPASAQSDQQTNYDQKSNSDLRAVGNPSSVATAKILLFENLRFWPGEEKNDAEFAKLLATLADCYVNDAFGNCHRAHASMVALPSLLPHSAGIHLEEEVNQLTKLIEQPQKPFVAIVGGAKIETKLPVISNLVKIADHVLVGGELPVEVKKDGQTFGENVTVATLTDDDKDISIESARAFSQIISSAKTVVWNGPMGLFEEGKVEGTLTVANAIISSGAYSVIGGGDSTQFLGAKGLLSKFSFVSAGGGAMLEFLAGHEMPGIEALN